MNNRLLAISVGALLILTACAGDDEQPTKEESFYMNFSLGDSAFSVTSQEYQLKTGSSSLSCARDYVDGIRSSEEYVRGFRSVILEDPKEAGFIRSLDFAISKKVYKDELDTGDEGSYMKEVLEADNFGFPINPQGYYTVYDPENNLFIVDRDIRAEAYFFIVTKDEEIYRSTSVVPNVRDDGSFFTIDTIMETKDSSVSEYQYIIEGRFKVNVFKGSYGTDSETMEGVFRWPVNRITNAELLSLCE